MKTAECGVHKLVADVALLAERRVLLVRYKDTAKYDRQTGWFLPDDFLAPYEHPDQASVRIPREQVGLADGVRPRLHHIESFGNGAWHLIFHYVAELGGAQPPTPGPNVAAARWFALDGLPDRAEVAHDGWALDVLADILGAG